MDPELPQDRPIEEQLRLYKEILRYSTDAVSILDAEGRYLENNPAHQQLLGYSIEELRGQTPALHSDAASFVRVGRTMFERGTFRGEVVSHTKEGREIYVDLSAFPVKDEDGEVLCYVGFARDITARKREEARRQAVQLVREAVWQMQGGEDVEKLLLAIGDGLDSLDIPYQNCGINVIDTSGPTPVMHSYTTTPEGRWLSSKTVEAVHTVKRMQEGGEPVYRRDLEVDDVFDECRYLQKHARIRAVVDVPFSHGTLAVNSLVADGFSERDLEVFQELATVLSEGFRRMEDLQQLVDAHAQLVQAEKMASLGNLVAGIAHEINTPVGAIHSMHDTLVRAVEKLTEAIEQDFPESYHEHRGLQRALQIIQDSNRVIESGTTRVTTIVKSLRNFARLDEVELVQVDLHEGLEDTLTIVNHDIKNRIEVVKNYGDIPRVFCYPSRLNQVFLNILNNARQAIDGKGTISITTSQVGEEVHVEIGDSGTGIAPEHLEKIFEPTFTTKIAGEGTGLGLSICRQIVEEHKGRIEVESEVGQGTMFRVVIPLGLAAEDRSDGVS
jgi:PAS domain S-box-containing protein